MNELKIAASLVGGWFLVGLVIFAVRNFQRPDLRKTLDAAPVGIALQVIFQCSAIWPLMAIKMVQEFAWPELKKHDQEDEERDA